MRTDEREAPIPLVGYPGKREEFVLLSRYSAALIERRA